LNAFDAGLAAASLPAVREYASVRRLLVKAAVDPAVAAAILGELSRALAQTQADRDALAAEAAERLRVQEILLRAERRYRHLVEHAIDIVYELGPNGRLTFVNEPATLRLLGYGASELVGRLLTEVVPVRSRKAVRTFTERQFGQPGTPAYLEFPVEAKDGRIVWLGQHCVVHADASGAALHAVCSDLSTHRGAVERAGGHMRDYSLHLQAQIEAERARIARDIHDELGAVLTGLRMELVLRDTAVARINPSLPPRNARLVRRIDAAIEATRRICGDLRPSLLDNLGLCAAIEWLVQQAQAQSTMRCRLALDGLPREPDSVRGTALYRIVQEAITNAIRHAGATTLTITQRCRGDVMEITVADDGRGITPEERNGHASYGLVGMRERAQAFGGSVEIAGPGRGFSKATRKGTRVTVQMPLGANPPEAPNESLADR
jgi:two-component system sensor histidine kinase UhpB